MTKGRIHSLIRTSVEWIPTRVYQRLVHPRVPLASLNVRFSSMSSRNSSKWGVDSAEEWLAAARGSSKPALSFSTGPLGTKKKSNTKALRAKSQAKAKSRRGKYNQEPKTKSAARSKLSQTRRAAQRTRRQPAQPDELFWQSCEATSEKGNENTANNEKTEPTVETGARSKKESSAKAANARMLQRGRETRAKLQEEVCASQQRKGQTDTDVSTTNAEISSDAFFWQSCEQTDSTTRTCELLLLQQRLSKEMVSLQHLLGKGAEHQKARQQLRQAIAKSCRQAVAKLSGGSFGTATPSIATSNAKSRKRIRESSSQQSSSSSLSAPAPVPLPVPLPGSAIKQKPQKRMKMVSHTRKSTHVRD